MTHKDLIEVRLTRAEAKALARLLNAAIFQIATDRQPVGNEITMQRAVKACKAGLEKIEVAIVATAAPATLAQANKMLMLAQATRFTNRRASP
jgi:hypothetical protein